MKLVSSVLLLLLVLPAQATPVKNWVKVWDGTYSYCRNTSDIYRYRHQVYSIRNQSLSISDDMMKLDLDLVFFQCTKNEDEKFTFSSVNPFDEYKFQNLFLPRNENLVTVNTDWVEVLVYRDGFYIPLVRTKIDRDLKLSGEFEVSKLLSEEEMDKVNNGEKVTVSFDFMINRLLDSRLDTNSDSSRGVINYGSFRRWLSVEKIDNALSVKKLNK